MDTDTMRAPVSIIYCREQFFEKEGTGFENSYIAEKA